MILALKTDQPEAELYLLDNTGKVVAEHRWLAERELSKNLLDSLQQFLKDNKLGFEQLTGIIVFQGPGSFTGLRIGITVANALAYSLSIPVVGTQETTWLSDGVTQLESVSLGTYVMPHYGQPASISRPKK